MFFVSLGSLWVHFWTVSEIQKMIQIVLSRARFSMILIDHPPFGLGTEITVGRHQKYVFSQEKHFIIIILAWETDRSSREPLRAVWRVENLKIYKFRAISWICLDLVGFQWIWMNFEGIWRIFINFGSFSTVRTL